jgi:hypothetical protein
LHVASINHGGMPDSSSGVSSRPPFNQLREQVGFSFQQCQPRNLVTAKLSARWESLSRQTMMEGLCLG